MPEPLRWDSVSPLTGEPLKWDQPGATWDGHWPDPPKPAAKKKKKKIQTPPPANLPAMSQTYQYVTRPTSNDEATTTQAVYRGTKTPDELIAEVTARLAGAPPTVADILRLHAETILDWTTQGWKIAPVHGLIGYRITAGGSIPTGEPEDWDFDSMNIDLNCHWGPEGEARSRALFSSEKVGEHSRAAPVFVEVYESETKELNQYEAGKGLVIRFGNRNFEFDPAQNCKVRFRKSDGTYEDAAGYPFIKGNTVVVIAPAGLTGTVHLEATALINKALRTAEYPFPLT